MCRLSFVAVLVALMVLVSGQEEEQCKEAQVLLKKELNGMLESGEYECATKHDLLRFKCTAGEDPDEDQKKAEEFQEFMGGLDDETKKEVVGCMEEMVSKAFEKTSGEMDEACQKMLQAEIENEKSKFE